MFHTQGQSIDQDVNKSNVKELGSPLHPTLALDQGIEFIICLLALALVPTPRISMHELFCWRTSTNKMSFGETTIESIFISRGATTPYGHISIDLLILLMSSTQAKLHHFLLWSLLSLRKAFSAFLRRQESYNTHV